MNSACQIFYGGCHLYGQGCLAGQFCHVTTHCVDADYRAGCIGHHRDRPHQGQ